MISTTSVRSSLYRRFLERIFPEKAPNEVIAPALDRLEGAGRRDRRVPDRRRRAGTLPGGRRAVDTLHDGVGSCASTDRRKEPRYVPRHQRAHLSWWTGDVFHTQPATVENLSRYGAAVVVDALPAEVNHVWIAFPRAPQRNWYAAEVVGGGRNADGAQTIRVALGQPLPYCAFSAVVWGLQRPGKARADVTTKLVSPAAGSLVPDPPTPTPTPGRKPNGVKQVAHYQVLQSLGAGGMGQVYLAEDSELARRVALKVMHPHLARDPSARLRFLREARAAAALQHDNIVTIYQVGQHDEIPFLAMPFLDGETLASWIERAGRPPLPEALRITREIAAGLTAAHQAGLIHRDVKPENIWLETPRQRVKLLDFGLARTIAQGSNLTQSGYLLGTPAYMSPEQALNAPCDHRSDLFSLGIVLYRLCGGALPFAGKSAFATLTAVTRHAPRPLHELNPELPASLVALIAQLLEKKPKHRPANTAAVQAALEAIEASLHATA